MYLISVETGDGYYRLPINIPPVQTNGADLPRNSFVFCVGVNLFHDIYILQNK